LGLGAFEGCEMLENINIPASFSYLGYMDFNRCTSLININVDEENKGISSIDGVLYSKDKTELIVFPAGRKGEYAIPEGTTSIRGRAFHRTSLKKLTIPNTIRKIDLNTFKFTNRLDSIEILSRDLEISEGAFKDMPSTIIYGYKESNAEKYAKENNMSFIPFAELEYQYNEDNTATVIGIKEGETLEGVYAIPSRVKNEEKVYTVTEIRYYAFSRCSSLRGIIIPEGITDIGFGAFYECSSLQEVILPSTLTKIQTNAFSGCINLTSITIPEGVTEIGEHAFYKCSSLTSVIIPSTVTKISEETFVRCTSLVEIKVTEGNERYASIDGVLFNKDKTELVRYPEGKGAEYIIPDGVTRIGDKAFYVCYFNLKSVILPEGLIDIGDNAFGFTSLGETVIPEGVKNIGDEAFYGSGFEEITIPASVENIGKRAFCYISGFEKIIVNENNKNYSSDEYGVLFNKDKTSLIFVPEMMARRKNESVTVLKQEI